VLIHVGDGGRLLKRKVIMSRLMKIKHHIYNVAILPAIALIVFMLVLKFNVYVWFWPSVDLIIKSFFISMLSTVPMYIFIIVISAPIYIIVIFLKLSPLLITTFIISITYSSISYIFYTNELQLDVVDVSSILISLVVSIAIGIFIHAYLLWSRLSNNMPNKTLKRDAEKAPRPLA